MSAHALPLAGLLAILLVYAIGTVRLWRLAGRGGGGLPRGAVYAFVAGWLAAFIALTSLVDRLSESLLWMHMTQHLLLITIAAPMVALGRPVVALAWALPFRVRRPVMRGGRWIAGGMFVAWAVHTLALWIWHVPALYEAALAHEAIHAVEHLTIAGTGVMFWAALFDAARRSRRGAAAAYVFATALHCTLLGALLTLAPHPWYAHYAITASAFGVGALEDQQLAGLLMWVPAGVALAVAGLALVAAWLREAERRVTVSRVERLRRSSSLVALVTLGVAATVLTACDGASRTTAAQMTGGDVRHGRDALRAYGCWTCHTIPGVTGANGVIGPPLTGLASRAFVAGQPNSPEHLIRWIRNPPAVRPSTPMPNVGVTERDGRDMAAYLYTLR